MCSLIRNQNSAADRSEGGEVSHAERSNFSEECLIPANSSGRLTWKTGLLVFIASLVMSYISEQPRPEVDCVPAPYAAWSVIKHGDFELGRYAALKKGEGQSQTSIAGGKRVSKYPVGTILTTVPVVLPFALLSNEPLPRSRMRRLGKLSSALYVAGASLMMFQTLRIIAPNAVTSIWLLFAAGTILTSVAAQACWSHGPATFFLMFALMSLLTRKMPENRYLPLLVGFSLGMSIITRPTTVFFLLATLALFLNQPRTFVKILLGTVPPAVIVCLYNTFYFGSPLQTGYGQEASAWTTPLSVGLSGLLISPSRGMLIFMPAFLLVPLGLYRVIQTRKREHTVLLMWFLAVLATILLYARWHCWWGGWSFGPRLLCETIPLLCVLVAVGVNEMSGQLNKAIISGLVTASIMIQYVGLFGYSAFGDWQQRHSTSESMFHVHDSLLEAHFRAAFHLDGRKL